MTFNDYITMLNWGGKEGGNAIISDRCYTRTKERPVYIHAQGCTGAKSSPSLTTIAALHGLDETLQAANRR
jgi:hypothetical protein